MDKLQEIGLVFICVCVGGGMLLPLTDWSVGKEGKAFPTFIEEAPRL